jgi:hypothetical protein
MWVIGDFRRTRRQSRHVLKAAPQAAPQAGGAKMACG